MSNFGGNDEKVDPVLRQMIQEEQVKAQFQAQVHNFTDKCWDTCVADSRLGNKLDYRTEACLQNCVERFLDTTISVTNRFTQLLQRGATGGMH
ncbi:mitochondrial import inner membrane translocase subunit Tim8 B-like [Branchiostoma floridae]|uniref:Mitochondrial import inner membrane translocase subunit n=1 Tax=Branchiostoma floridae TaxID=7739 RepID=A0A9J7LF24_BRAFL|nr:mitochondrial import inner membrane translocase subunit Tim8 B-like [Branchiostoma floridae]